MPPASPFQRMVGRGPCDVGYAVRSYADDRGAHRCDVVCVDNGLATYLGCYVLNNQGSKIGAPREEWTGGIDPSLHPLVVVIHRSQGLNPIVLGRLDNANISFSAEPTKQEYDEESDNTPERATPDDVVMANDDSQLLLKSRGEGGDVVLIPGRRFTVQLKPGGFMRVAQDETASDGPVLASRSVVRDGQLVAAIAEVQAYLRRLTVAGPTGALKPVEPFLGTDLEPLDPEDIQSAVIRLPSRAVSAAGVIEGDDGRLAPDEES